VELIKNPSCLFLDEPTSGLDSFQAQSVMSCLRDLGKNGRTVIASIHQPRSSIFAMFDKLLLLSEGQCVFYGDANASVNYFTRQGFECPTTFVRRRASEATSSTRSEATAPRFIATFVALLLVFRSA